MLLTQVIRLKIKQKHLNTAKTHKIWKMCMKCAE